MINICLAVGSAAGDHDKELVMDVGAVMVFCRGSIAISMTMGYEADRGWFVVPTFQPSST